MEVTFPSSDVLWLDITMEDHHNKYGIIYGIIIIIIRKNVKIKMSSKVKIS